MTSGRNLQNKTGNLLLLFVVEFLVGSLHQFKPHEALQILHTVNKQENDQKGLG